MMPSTEDEEWANKLARSTKKKCRHKMPFTYGPKILAIAAGDCTQTIRASTKYNVGDRILMYSWNGAPYGKGSSWVNRTTVEVTEVVFIIVSNLGIEFPLLYGDQIFPWTHEWVDELAAKDFIDPPTGIELRKVLEKYLKMRSGEEKHCQIVKWKIDPETV